MTLAWVSSDRAQEVSLAVRQNTNLALAMEAEATRTLKAAEQALWFLRHAYEAEGALVTIAMLADGRPVERDVFTAAILADAQGYILLPDGKLGPVNVSDRNFFRFHRDHAGAQTLVSAPITGRLTERSIIPVSQRRTLPDGSFGGVYSVGLEPRHFLASYQRFDLGGKGLMQLVKLDGVSLARRASGKVSFGDDMRESSLLKYARAEPNGSFVSAGRVDGVARFVSYRTLPEYGLLLAVGTSVEEAMAEFHAREAKFYLTAKGVTLGMLLFAVLLITFITRHMRATQGLAEKEALYRATFEQAVVGIAHATKEGRFLRVNPKLCRMLGYSEPELLARGWLDITHPDDRARSLALVGKMISGPANDKPELEKRYVRKDGSLLWGIASLAVVPRTDGTPDYFVTVLQDITSRKLAEAALRDSEERFRRYFELGLIGMTITAPSKGIVEANDKMCEILGYARGELLRLDWARLTHPEDLQADIRQFQRVLAGEIDGYSIEKRFIRKDGRVINCNIAVRIVRQADGAPQYFVALAEDITARKEAEAHLHEQLDELRRFEKVTVDRELRMIELERELEHLKRRMPA